MKKLIAMSLAAIMAVAGLAGCGNQAAETDGENTLVIGGIGPVTGAAATYGQAVKNGAELAVKEINAAGGVNGMTLKFLFEDDEHDAEKSVNAYNTLKDKGIQLLMGTVTSTPCVAVAEKTFEDNMFQLTPSGSSVDCITHDNAFRICFSDPNQGIASAQYIADNNLATKVAVIYNSSDVYSSGIYEKFATEAANKGLEIVAAEAFTKDSATDFTVQIQKVKESGAELLFLPIYYQEAALILTQADKVDLDVEFFGCDGLDGVIAQLGDQAALADGVMLLTPFAADAKDEKTVAFTTAYKAAYNDEIPTQFAADAYDAIYVIKAALEKAEVSDANIAVSDLCEKLKAAMVEIEVPGVTGTMTWTADGEPTKDPKAMYIENGAYKAR
ncbi:MAG: ABC transporter substrate-binding protein [Clostridia bacterium]|nr:ABC transporter substrate-binding protein [Clostridia bacterium]